MKKTTFVPYFMLMCALFGMAIASYDCYMIYTGQLLWCPPPIDGCNTVAYSPHGRIFGVPIGYFGLTFYSVMFLLAALLAFASSSRGLRLVVLFYAALGVCGSIGFMYLDLTLIRAFCIYCLISAILTVLLLLFALAHFRAPNDAGHRLIADEA
jgi:uncharacterized membrane protein